MNKAQKLWKELKNKDESIRLIKWMISVVKLYFRFVIYYFIISLISMGIFYASTIIGKYVVDDATVYPAPKTAAARGLNRTLAARGTAPLPLI